MSRTIYLGNAAVHPDINRDPANPDAETAPPPAQGVTIVHPPDDAGIVDVLNDVVKLWQAHSTAAPSWVAADDPQTAGLLSAQFAGCPVKSIDDAAAEYATASTGGAA